MGPRHPNRLDRTAPSTQRSLTLVGRRTGRNFGVIRGRRPGPCQPRPEPALDADCATRHHHPADLNDPPQVVPCSWRSPGPYELAHDTAGTGIDQQLRLEGLQQGRRSRRRGRTRR